MNEEVHCIEDIAGQSAFKKDAIGWREDGKYPDAILLYGPPGTGKTTSAHVIARELLGEFYDPINYIVTNASDDRGIDIIRNQINSFVETKALFGKGKIEELERKNAERFKDDI